MMSAEEAREKAFHNLEVAKRGYDPRSKVQVSHYRNEVKHGVPTFREEAERVIELKSSSWKHAKLMGRKWRSTFERYVFPVIGDIPVDRITRQDIKAILEPKWVSKNAAMREALQRVSEIFKVAMAEDHVNHNPASNEILKILPRLNGERKHHKALPHEQVAEAVQKIRNNESYPGTKLCLEFLILTSVRSVEAREVEWRDVDMEKGIWTVPAGKMKAKEEHRVPLSEPVLSVLKKAKKIKLTEKKTGLVFPAQSGRVMHSSILTKLLKKEGIDSTVHGFRTSFSTWANEKNYNPDAIEACLAHTTPGVRGAYMRGEFFEQRREIMQAWSDYIVPAYNKNHSRRKVELSKHSE